MKGTSMTATTDRDDTKLPDGFVDPLPAVTKQRPSPVVPPAPIDQLMAKVDAEGLELLGPDGVLADITKAILERALEEERTEHLGYEAGDPAGRGSGTGSLWRSGPGHEGGGDDAGRDHERAATHLRPPPDLAVGIGELDAAGVATDNAIRGCAHPDSRRPDLALTEYEHRLSAQLARPKVNETHGWPSRATGPHVGPSGVVSEEDLDVAAGRAVVWPQHHVQHCPAPNGSSMTNAKGTVMSSTRWSGIMTGSAPSLRTRSDHSDPWSSLNAAT